LVFQLKGEVDEWLKSAVC